MKKFVVFASLVAAGVAWSEEPAKPQDKPQDKHKEYIPAPPIHDINWALKYDKNQDGRIDEAELVELQAGWQERQRKFGEFKQWEREFRDRAEREERELKQRQEKETQEFREKRRQEYLQACERYGVPPPVFEDRRKDGQEKAKGGYEKNKEKKPEPPQDKPKGKEGEAVPAKAPPLEP